MLASFTHLPIADVRPMRHTPPAFFMPADDGQSSEGKRGLIPKSRKKARAETRKSGMMAQAPDFP
jgi:hypothetical protein